LGNNGKQFDVVVISKVEYEKYFDGNEKQFGDYAEWFDGKEMPNTTKN